MQDHKGISGVSNDNFLKIRSLQNVKTFSKTKNFNKQIVKHTTNLKSARGLLKLC